MAFSLNTVKNLYVATLWFFCIETSNLSSTSYGTCPCVTYSEFCVKGFSFSVLVWWNIFCRNTPYMMNHIQNSTN